MKKIIFDKSKHKIAIIAPGSASRDAAENLKLGAVLLQDQGFIVTYKEFMFSSTGDLPYFSAAKPIRLKHLKDALLDPEIGIIWAFRGGYGCTEIVFECLEFNLSSPKILIGFSDITALHFLMLQKYNLPTIHGSVVTSLLHHQPTMLPEIISVLSGKNMMISIKNLSEGTSKRKIDGIIAGGNLTLICNMIGTKLHPEFEGKIILLEDINERGYQVHRHLIHMKNSDLFKNVQAVIFGDFINSDEVLEKSISSFCENYLPHIPTYRIKGIGHGDINYPIVFGGHASIEENILKIVSPFELI